MVIYEDNHLLVVNKECGEIVQGDATRDPTILDRYKAYIKKKYNKPGAVFLHPVHRLDRPVSGCLILARTSKALSRMTIAFRDRAVTKTYHAISHKRSNLESGRAHHFMIKDREKNKSRIVKPKYPKSKEAILDYSLMSSLEGRHLYEVRPHTGRSHQIRVQMQALASPILGDLKYGGTQISRATMIYLHCSELSFIHPVKKEEMTLHSLPTTGELWRPFSHLLSQNA